MTTIHNDEEINRLREYFKNNTIPIDVSQELETGIVDDIFGEGDDIWIQSEDEKLSSTLRLTGF